MKNLFLLALIATSITSVASAADHTFNLSPNFTANRRISYGADPCVITVGNYIYVWAKEGTTVHVVSISRKGVDEGWVLRLPNSPFVLQTTGPKLAQKLCGDTLLLLPNKDQEEVRPFLLAEK